MYISKKKRKGTYRYLKEKKKVYASIFLGTLVPSSLPLGFLPCLCVGCLWCEDDGYHGANLDSRKDVVCEQKKGTRRYPKKSPRRGYMLEWYILLTLYVRIFFFRSRVQNLVHSADFGKADVRYSDWSFVKH